MAFKRLKSIAQLGHVPKHDDHSARAWLYGKLLVTLLVQKLIRIGRNTSPQATHHKWWGPHSPSREFGFALHLVQQAIEPNLSLQQTVCSWNQIARALAERSRMRSLQLGTWHLLSNTVARSDLDATFVLPEASASTDPMTAKQCEFR
jgi:hypothetical protein